MRVTTPAGYREDGRWESRPRQPDDLDCFQQVAHLSEVFTLAGAALECLSQILARPIAVQPEAA
jgi:hypothetical protein